LREEAKKTNRKDIRGKLEILQFASQIFPQV